VFLCGLKNNYKFADAIQFALFLFGAIFTLVCTPSMMDGGLSAVIAKTAAGGKPH
jgi:hypothetical protein